MKALTYKYIKRMKKEYIGRLNDFTAQLALTRSYVAVAPKAAGMGGGDLWMGLIGKGNTRHDTWYHRGAVMWFGLASRCTFRTWLDGDWSNIFLEDGLYRIIGYLVHR